MKVKFTNHAQANLLGRGITASRVVDTLRSPDSTGAAFEGKSKARKKFGNKTLEVVYLKEKSKDKKGEYLVITGYYL